MRLRRELYLLTLIPDYMSAIRRNILEHLPPAGKLSMAEPVETFGADFKVDWDPLTFIMEQQYKTRPSEALAGVQCTCKQPLVIWPYDSCITKAWRAFPPSYMLATTAFCQSHSAHLLKHRLRFPGLSHSILSYTSPVSLCFPSTSRD